MSQLVAAVVSLAAAAVRPRPWVFATALLLLLCLVWTEAFVRHARLGEPFVEEEAP